MAAHAVGLAAEHAARAQHFLEGLVTGQFHVSGIILVLWFLLGVEVVEIAEELVEAVQGRQMFVKLALVGDGEVFWVLLAALSFVDPMSPILDGGRHPS